MSRPVTLITGASAGLGAEFARKCSARGEEVVLVARRRDRLEALAAELGNAHVVAADLAEPRGATRVIGELVTLELHVARLINNAGFGLLGGFAHLSLPRQREMIDLNVRTLTDFAYLVLPEMLERRQGAILNVASTAAFQAGPHFAVYFATKAYVLSFSEALHQELKGSGIKVSCLCPGPTATEFGEVAGFRRAVPAWLSADAAGVVAAGLKGLDRNKAVVIPGAINKLSAQSSRFLPRAAMRRLVGLLKA